MASDPFEDAIALFAALPGQREQLRLVGGLAVRAHVGPLARKTVDVDLVALTDGAQRAVLDHLTAAGYHVGQSGGWWRAILRDAQGQHVVDIGAHPVVNPRTFETLSLRAPAWVTSQHGVEVRSVGVDDLATLKLAAGRDQDLVDLLLLCAHCRPSAEHVARSAELDDCERSLAAAAAAARAMAEGSDLDGICTELLGRAAAARERQELVAFLAALRRVGL